MAFEKFKKVRKEDWKTIGIIGTGPCVGTTHFCIMLANYFAGVRRKKTAVIEWNQSGDFSALQKICIGKRMMKKPFRVLEVSYFTCVSKEEAAWCFSQDFDKIVIDFGWDKSRKLDLLRCERKAVITSLSEWQLQRGLDFFADREEKRDKSWGYYAVFGSEEARRELMNTFKIALQRIPFSEDAFAVTGEILSFFTHLS